MSRALADAMRTAADTLEAVSGLYGAQHYPAEYPWSATELRREAEHVEHVEQEPSL